MHGTGKDDKEAINQAKDVVHGDQYGRLLACVYLGDEFVNAELVRAGYAVLYTMPPNVAHVEEYRKAEVDARESGRRIVTIRWT